MQIGMFYRRQFSVWILQQPPGTPFLSFGTGINLFADNANAEKYDNAGPDDSLFRVYVCYFFIVLKAEKNFPNSICSVNFYGCERLPTSDCLNQVDHRIDNQGI